MSDFKDALHDLFSYLRSPYFDYDDYLDHKYDDDCNFDNDYHNYDCDDLVDLFSDEPIETIIEDIRNEYLINEDIIEHYEDFKKETNIHFLSKLKFQIKNLNTLFNDKPGNMNFDSHFVSRIVNPILDVNNSIKSIKELTILLIKMILSRKIIDY
jgi:hypothetical protein